MNQVWLAVDTETYRQYFWVLDGIVSGGLVLGTFSEPPATFLFFFQHCRRQFGAACSVVDLNMEHNS
jgi:hypothetical protein